MWHECKNKVAYVLLLWNGGRRTFGVSGALTAVAKHCIILLRCSLNQVKYGCYRRLFSLFDFL